MSVKRRLQLASIEGRARLLLSLVAASWGLFGAFHLASGRPFGGVHLIAAILALVCRGLISEGAPPERFRAMVHASAGVNLAALMALGLLTGEASSPANWFFGVVPLLVIYALPTRSVGVWVIASGLGLCIVHFVLWRWPAANPTPPLPFEPLIAQLILASFSVFGSLGSRRALDRQIALLEAGRQALDEQGAELARARDRALEALRVKDDFLAAMSHELRTPLNAVIGMASLMAVSELTPQQREQLEAIQSGGETLLALIGDILDLAKVEAGKVPVDARPVDLATLVERCLGLVAQPARGKGLELAYALTPGTPETVVTDGDKVQQILTNLLSNAVKFTSDGAVTLTATATPEEGSRTKVSFAVTDTGMGIADAVRPHLFQPFSQGDASITRRYGGTGLGLAISRKLAVLLGGDLVLTASSPGGSTFTCTLAGEVPHERPHERPKAVEGLRALVVAEHPATALCLVAHAERLGLVVERVAETKLVEPYLESHTPDLVIADTRAPSVEGPILVQLARKARIDVPVILLRHHGAVVVPGAVTLAKPLSFRRFSDVVSAAVARAAPGPTDTRGQTTGPAPVVSSGTALVVDDNALNRKVAAQMMAALGFTAKVVDSGAAAIEAVRGESFDVVLMDIQMPDMDGFEAVRQLRSVLQGRAVPRIIAVTANALVGERERCLAAGMDDYVAKPVRLGLLSAALRAPPRSAEER